MIEGLNTEAIDELAQKYFGDSFGLVIVVDLAGVTDIHERVMVSLDEVSSQAGMSGGHWNINVSHNENCAGREGKDMTLCDCPLVIAFCRKITDEEAALLTATQQYDEFRESPSANGGFKLGDNDVDPSTMN